MKAHRLYPWLVVCHLYLLSVASTASPHRPPWVASLGRRSAFPASVYLTGFGSARGGIQPDWGTLTDAAKQGALAALAQKLQITVRVDAFGVSVSRTDGASRSSTGSGYGEAITSSSDVRLQGIRFDTWTDHENQTVYALALLNKEQSIRDSRAAIQRLAIQLRYSRKQARRLATVDAPGADERFASCVRIVGDMNRLAAFIRVLGENVEPHGMSWQNVEEARLEARMRLRRQALTPGECARLLALQIHAQYPHLDATIQVNMFTEEGLGLSSRFAKELTRRIESQLSMHTSLRTVFVDPRDRQQAGRHAARMTAAAGGAELLFSGTYEVQDTAITITARIVDVRTAAVLAAVSSALTSKAVPSRDLRPSAPSLVDGWAGRLHTLSSGLQLQAWTSRGDEYLVLEEGDKLLVHVRVNMPCYLRVLIRLATGHTAVMHPHLLNYRIGPGLVNSVITLPDTLVVCPPFGRESIGISASRHPFDDVHLETQQIEGEWYACVSDSQGTPLQRRNRGLKVNTRSQERRTGVRKTITVVSMPARRGFPHIR